MPTEESSCPASTSIGCVRKSPCSRYSSCSASRRLLVAATSATAVVSCLGVRSTQRPCFSVDSAMRRYYCHRCHCHSHQLELWVAVTWLSLHPAAPRDALNSAVVIRTGASSTKQRAYRLTRQRGHREEATGTCTAHHVTIRPSIIVIRRASIIVIALNRAQRSGPSRGRRHGGL